MRSWPWKPHIKNLERKPKEKEHFPFFYVVLMLASPWFTRLVFMLASYVWIRLTRHLLRDFMKCRPKAQFYSLPVEYTMGIVFLDTFSISVTENLFHFSQNSSFFLVPGKAYHPTEQSALGITKCGRIERNFIVSAKFWVTQNLTAIVLIDLKLS